MGSLPAVSAGWLIFSTAAKSEKVIHSPTETACISTGLNQAIAPGILLCWGMDRADLTENCSLIE